MPGFFFNFGKFVGEQSRKAGWVVESLTGTDEDAMKAEHAVGQDMARAILTQAPPDPDPAVAKWLDEIGGVMTEAVRPRGRTFSFRSILVPEPNAFALPGGFVFVTRELLKLCKSSHDDLAFILGHEMGHIVKGHAVERMVTGSLLRAGVSLLRLPAAQIFSSLLSSSYSQDQELEADREGLHLMKRAGFDPNAAVRLFENLRLQLAGPSELMGYFASHPSWEIRIEQLRKEAAR